MGAAPDRNRPKHQHWVPQFYLRYFATPASRDSDRPQVWIFSRRDEDGDEQLTHVRNVCGKRYLYSSLDAAGERQWALEDRLGDIEQLLSRIWPALAEDFVPLDEDSVRKGLSLFIAITHLRHPEVRQQVEEIHSKIVRSLESVPRNEDGSPNIGQVEYQGRLHDFDTTGWAEYLQWGKNDHDAFFAQAIQSEAANIAKLLMAKRWSVVCADQDTFITTDKPVALQHLSRATFGFRTPDVIVSFPLGPKRMLVMDDLHHEPANQYYPLKGGYGAAFNFTTWRNGSRFMITGRPVPEVLQELLDADFGADAPGS